MSKHEKKSRNPRMPNGNVSVDDSHDPRKEAAAICHVYIDSSYKVDFVDDVKKKILVRDKGSEPQRWIGVLSVVLGMITAIFLGLQVRYLKEANEALVAIQRPFVNFKFIEAPRKKLTTTGKHFYTFVPTFENSGATPANIFATGYGWKFTEEPSEDEFRGTVYYGNLPMAPKGTQSVGAARVDEEDIFGNDIDLSKISNVVISKPVVVWAWLAYRDNFPGTKIHVTEYCSGIRGASPVDRKNIAFEHGSCGSHNCSDEYCPDYQQIVDTASNKRKK